VPIFVPFENLQSVRVALHDENRETVPIPVRPARSERDEQDVGVRREVDEPFLPVDDPLVAVPVGSRPQVGDIRPALGLGERLRDDELAG
jgi:hypothetical protein